MRLLSPQETKVTQDKNEAERVARLERLRKDEGAAVARINALLVREKEETQKCEENAEKRKAMLSVQKTVLEQEVEALEARKLQALKPVHELQNEAREVLDQVRADRAVLDRKTAEADARESALRDRALTIAERADELEDHAQALERREIGIKAAEAEVKKSTEILAKEWVKFHTEVGKANENIGKREQAVTVREKEVEDARKANDAVREDLKREAARLVQERRAIQDAHRELAQAKEHIHHGT